MVPESGKANDVTCQPLLDDLKSAPPKAPPPGKTMPPAKAAAK
jgi:hypothetical protein